MIDPCANLVEDIRRLMDMSQREFAELLGMPLRTYEDKARRGFNPVDLKAAKWVYYKAGKVAE